MSEIFFNYFYEDVGISLKAYGNNVQDVKLYTQNAPQYEGDCEYRISSINCARNVGNDDLPFVCHG